MSIVGQTHETDKKKKSVNQKKKRRKLLSFSFPDFHILDKYKNRTTFLTTRINNSKKIRSKKLKKSSLKNKTPESLFRYNIEFNFLQETKKLTNYEQVLLLLPMPHVEFY